MANGPERHALTPVPEMALSSEIKLSEAFLAEEEEEAAGSSSIEGGSTSGWRTTRRGPRLPPTCWAPPAAPPQTSRRVLAKSANDSRCPQSMTWSENPPPLFAPHPPLLLEASPASPLAMALSLPLPPPMAQSSVASYHGTTGQSWPPSSPPNALTSGLAEGPPDAATLFLDAPATAAPIWISLTLSACSWLSAMTSSLCPLLTVKFAVEAATPDDPPGPFTAEPLVMVGVGAEEGFKTKP